MFETGRLRTRATRYLGDAARGIQQAPIEVITALSIAMTFSWALEMEGQLHQSWAEFAVACVLLLAIAWTGTLLQAMGAWGGLRRWLLTLGGAVAAAIYAHTLADFQYQAEVWRAVLLIGAAVLWLIALPAFGGARDGRTERMRRVDGRVLLRVIGALLYGAALFAGLALALGAIDVLFELELNENIYAHVWGWIFFALVPWIVIGGLPDYVRPADGSSQVAGVAHRIALYLVPPLLALYGLILYAYVVRILVTGEVPKNLVSPMVLAAGGLAALALLLFDPKPGRGGLARLLRLAPPLFLPLVPLGAWALVMRVNQYGWTEFRAVRIIVLGALAVLAVAATFQLVRRRPFALHVAPVGLAAVFLLAGIGPWSALAISRDSQQDRLESALTRVDIPPGDTAYAPVRPDEQEAERVVPAATYEQIRSSARYLASHFGPDALPPVLRGLGGHDDARWLDYASELALRPDSPLEGEAATRRPDVPPDREAGADPDVVSAEMDRVYERFTRAYRLGEVDSVVVLYADSPLYLPAQGDVRRGTNALREQFEFLERAREGGATPRIEFESIARSSSGNLGYDVGYYTLRVEEPDGTLTPPSRGKFTTVWQRDDQGRWRILIDSYSPAPPASEL